MQGENSSYSQVQATVQATESQIYPAVYYVSPDPAFIPSTSDYYSYLRVTSTPSKERSYQKQQYVRYSHLLIIIAHHLLSSTIQSTSPTSSITYSFYFTSASTVTQNKTNMRERSRGSMVSLSKCLLTHVTTNTNKHESSLSTFPSKDNSYPTTATGLNSPNKFS